MFETILCLSNNANKHIRIFVPFTESLQILGPSLIIKDEGHYSVSQTLLKHNQSSHTSVSILKGEDSTKVNMEG